MATQSKATKSTPRKRTAKSKSKPYYTVYGVGGRRLFALTLAVLEEAGAMKPGGTVDRSFLASFYQTPRIISHHVSAGNIERVDGGKLKLTPKGFNHFNGRRDGSNIAQAIHQAWIDEARQLIKTGKAGPFYKGYKPEPVRGS